MVKLFDYDERLREISMFFQENDAVHHTMAHVVEKLEQANIPYAIVGGMAVNAHKYQRTTGDVDVLVTAEGFAEFVRRFVPGDFETARTATMEAAVPLGTVDVLVLNEVAGLMAALAGKKR